MTIWEIIDPYFTKDENWGDPDRMNGFLLFVMSALRQEIHCQFVVHFGTQGNHTDESQHYLGNADDGHFITDMPFYDQIIRVEEVLADLQVADRVGLGIYPAWSNPGFHIDVRGNCARWGWIGELKPDGSKEYCSYRDAKLFALSQKHNPEWTYEMIRGTL